MKCPKCNCEIENKWNFCPECGTVLYGRTKNVPFPDVVIMCYGNTTSLVIGGTYFSGVKEIIFSHSMSENDGLPSLQIDFDITKPQLPPVVSEFWREELKRVLSKQEHPKD